MSDHDESKRQLRIGMICDPIGGNKSGVVVSTLRFSKLLKERGHHVIFIGARSQEHRRHSHHDGIKAYRYRSIPVPKSGGWNLAFPTVKELKRVFEQEEINVVHIILPMSGAIMAIRAARSLNIKIVAHSHSQPENLFMDMPGAIRPTLNNLWNKYLAWVYGKAESLIYPSEMARGLLDKLSPRHQPSAVISNGINLKEFRPAAIGDFHKRFNIPDHKVTLLFVGRLYPEKSVDTLIKAVPHIVEEHKRTHVMIIGAGHLRSKLEKLAHRLGVDNHVTFLGLVSEEDKILAYNASDVFVLPSLAELEGMAVLEAMACGKPIIIADAAMSASRFFVDDNGFLFKTGDHHDLARQALKLIVDADLRKKMGENSFEKSKRYDIYKSVDLLEGVYYAALKKPMKESYFEEKGLYYKTNAFEQHRPTLVFLHGLSGSSSAWLPYEKLFENSYNMVTFDIRGHGKSKKFTHHADYEIKKFADDLHNLVVHLNISTFVLISHSFGTLIALEYIKSFRENVLASVFLSPMLDINKNFSARLLRPVLGLSHVFNIFPFHPKPGHHVDYSQHPHTTDWNIRRCYADVRNTTLRVYLYCLRQSLILEQEYFLERIKMPTLIVHGTRDTMAPVKNSIRMSKKIEGSELVLIPYTDHIIVLNNVEEVSMAIETFLKKITTQAERFFEKLIK